MNNRASPGSRDLRVSVAMTTYNGARFVIEQLESIRKQSHQVDEVVICDDRSTDNTVRLIKEYIDKHQLCTWRIYVNDVNLGFGDNFLHAVSKCKGDLVFLSDQDDVWYDSKVKELTSYLIKHPSIACVASAYDLCNSEGSIMDKEIVYQWRGNDGSSTSFSLERLIVQGWRARGSSMCFRREILSGEPSFRVDVFGHDTLISFYAIIKAEMVFYSKSLFKYRIHDHNSSIIALKKSSIFSAKSIMKHIRWLECEASMVLRLADHRNVSELYRKKMINHANFLNRRARLIQKLSVKSLLGLMGSIHEYRRNSFHSLLRAYAAFLKDVCYSMAFFKLSKDNAASGKS